MSTQGHKTYVCFGEPGSHLGELRNAADNDGNLEWWTVNSAARAGDEVVFYLTRPLSSFVAIGLVTSDPFIVNDPASRWSGHKAAEIASVRMLPRFVHVSEARELFPEWGFLRQPRQSTALPDELVDRFLRLLESGSRA